MEFLSGVNDRSDERHCVRCVRLRQDQGSRVGHALARAVDQHVSVHSEAVAAKRRAVHVLRNRVPLASEHTPERREHAGEAHRGAAAPAVALPRLLRCARCGSVADAPPLCFQEASRREAKKSRPGPHKPSGAGPASDFHHRLSRAAHVAKQEIAHRAAANYKFRRGVIEIYPISKCNGLIMYVPRAAV